MYVTRLRGLESRADVGGSSQSAGDINKPGGRLTLLSAGYLSSQSALPLFGDTKLYCLVTRGGARGHPDRGAAFPDGGAEVSMPH